MVDRLILFQNKIGKYRRFLRINISFKRHLGRKLSLRGFEKFPANDLLTLISYGRRKLRVI